MAARVLMAERALALVEILEKVSGQLDLMFCMTPRGFGFVVKPDLFP